MGVNIKRTEFTSYNNSDGVGITYANTPQMYSYKVLVLTFQKPTPAPDVAD